MEINITSRRGDVSTITQNDEGTFINGKQVDGVGSETEGVNGTFVGLTREKKNTSAKKVTITGCFGSHFDLDDPESVTIVNSKFCVVNVYTDKDRIQTINVNNLGLTMNKRPLSELTK